MTLGYIAAFDETLAEFDLEGKPLAELPEDSPAQRGVVEMVKKMGL